MEVTMKNLSQYNEELSVPRKKDVDARQAKINVVGPLQGNGNGDISVAETVQAETANAQVLPTVTTSDNGKFLRVVSGQWQAVAVPDANGTSF